MKEVVYLEDLKQLEDPKNNVVDVAKATNQSAKMTNDNNTPIDTTNVTQTPLNAASTDTT
ncbi:hypothetical protein IGI04_023619 [Brassica rapa subsp. trilocularis]|uniref:Uncharacterized protein n=1 Tax=Brassica rapa subsp. trilocularis TaxID=1813537 RepID=A0ABQ7M6V3_BRACM|nr:hypothetical protein IGI04_023619 [Brassica rapa subsp. trilocularis]